MSLSRRIDTQGDTGYQRSSEQDGKQRSIFIVDMTLYEIGRVGGFQAVFGRMGILILVISIL